MGWFSRFKTRTKPPETKRAKRLPPPDPKLAGSRPRRERYSAWNDPDLPTYGDPFDG